MILSESISQILETENNRLLPPLLTYLLKNPSNFIDNKKLLKCLLINKQKLESLFKILEKENIGSRLYTYKTDLYPANSINHYKFFFQDFHHFSQEKIINYRPEQAGAIFEQEFYSQICHIEQINIFTFRTSNHIEVDFIIESENQLWAIELKKDQYIYASDLSGLHYFDKSTHESKNKILLVLHNGTRETKSGKVWILPMNKGIDLLKQSLPLTSHNIT